LRAVRGIDRAAERRRISHFWIHPINLAAAPSVMLPAMDQILTHAARLRDAGRIDILPMGAIAAEASRREGAGGL
jgi:hypothetical protein